MSKHIKYAKLVSRILLGLLVLIPGAYKLFVLKADAVSGMLSGIGFPTPLFFAWVLIILEIGCGVSILANYKIKYAVVPPILIMLIAAFTVSWGNWPNMLLHLVAASSFWLLALHSEK